eukprot:TRINITY_DN10614_c0_g3_i1.p1 TRINITY_DN10614_c0_g3~~TRINITY_DN10614_c0_g3_i1.p1  ORF type:complete len:584 (+),score=95.91 TRINITY_DN10614_c0_g3_i1:98-1849(+)
MDHPAQADCAPPLLRKEMMAGLSEEFGALVNALIAQHQKEISTIRANPAPVAKVVAAESSGVRARTSSETFSAKNALEDHGVSLIEETPSHLDLSSVTAKSEGGHSAQHKFIASVEKCVEALTTDIIGEDSDDDALKDQEVEPHSSSLFQRVEDFFHSFLFEMLISCLLGVNVIFMAAEMQVEGLLLGHRMQFYDHQKISSDRWPTLKETFATVDLVFNCIFAVDVFTRIIVLRFKFFGVVMNWIDFIVVTTNVIVVSFGESNPIKPSFLRLMRIGKLARALRMVELSNSLDSLQLLLKCLYSSVAMLFWSFLLLVFLQCVAGMTFTYLARDYMDLQPKDNEMLEVQQKVFQYYGTFSRTLLTMFEVLFANWSPPCRVLVENVHEAFSVAFLIYRCVIGFAVLNVVNAVFVQQTMKVAAADEEHAFRQRSKDQTKYGRLIQRLFSQLDASGDGLVCFAEFKNMLQLPKLKFWLSRLDLEYHDLLGLFELLDDGDGNISLEEFTAGVLRLKGQAKSIDVWRLEVKMEVILAKLLELVQDADPSGAQEVKVASVLEDAGFRNQYVHSSSDVFALTAQEDEGAVTV